MFYGAAAPFRFAEVPVIRNSRLPDIVDNPAARYVLLLDGVDESYYDPYLEWSRYLPSSVGLDRREHDKQVNTFSTIPFKANLIPKIARPLVQVLHLLVLARRTSTLPQRHVQSPQRPCIPDSSQNASLLAYAT